ncbi:YdeI/OmpD-associated family protein [Terracidiphilus gabretensis]|jgi:hypothetical protein|uniref:YdeI/OmpD-associated family protein n=1 Tax=Terracidiphilus gabretensis TaxID=1577687 RepID=UPI00071B0CC6|nr:YdeI/OmpD-associated family protein [Terracidiphilus gabretensis]
MKTYKFKAKIGGESGDSCSVYFPHDAEKEFGTRGRVPVKATFDGVPYSGSLMKYGSVQHLIPVIEAIRAQIDKNIGDTIDVTITRDETERTIETPEDFTKLLKKEKLQAIFETLSYSHRKEYVRWITEAKKEETRQRRLIKAVEMLRDGVKTPG